ncbi:MAG: nuclear transport factor 2 family protein [Pseudomonadota bacterium]
MSTEDNKQVVTEFFEAGNRGDVPRCMALLSDDVDWCNYGNTKFSGPFKGKQELGEKLMGPLFGSLKNGLFTGIDRLIAEGDTVVMQGTGQAETHDGTPYNNQYCMVIEVRDGKIQSVVEYADTALVNDVFGR